MESRESSSPLITRSVAGALAREAMDVYEFSFWQKLALRVVGALPMEVAVALLPRVQKAGALGAASLQNLKIDQLIEQRLQDYAVLEGPFSGVVLGVGMGGATAHIATASGAPFLPQAFVLTLKGGAEDGDVTQYFCQGADVAKRLTENNPEVISIQHYDPVHDGWLTRSCNHIRLKLTCLPAAYKKFILSRVVPGGDVIYLEGGAQWQQYQTGLRNRFQVGGWGAISTDTFLSGNDTLAAYARQAGLKKWDWNLPGYDRALFPESEWGSEAGLREELEAFCRAEGFCFRPVHFDRPEDFSRLAFVIQKHRLDAAGIEPRGVLVETFSQYDALAVEQAGLLPLWLIFNTLDSADFLEQMSDQFPKAKPVFFSALATFSLTPDLAAWERWMAILRPFQVIEMGARKSHYPADAAALLDWVKPLRNWVMDQPQLELPRLTGAEFELCVQQVLAG